MVGTWQNAYPGNLHSYLSLKIWDVKGRWRKKKTKPHIYSSIPKKLLSMLLLSSVLYLCGSSPNKQGQLKRILGGRCNITKQHFHYWKSPYTENKNSYLVYDGFCSCQYVLHVSTSSSFSPGPGPQRWWGCTDLSQTLKSITILCFKNKQTTTKHIWHSFQGCTIWQNAQFYL